MATEFTWSIPTLEYFPSKDGFNDVVHIIHWVLVGTDGDLSSSVYGTQNLNTDDLNPDKYVAYDNLTFETVVSWLEESLGVDRINELHTIVQQNIDNMKNPPNVVTPPPWA